MGSMYCASTVYGLLDNYNVIMYIRTRHEMGYMSNKRKSKQTSTLYAKYVLIYSLFAIQQL